jgi:hypothetical protein
MIVDIGEYFSESPLLAVTDSWFGNAGLLKPVRKVLGERFDILSRRIIQGFEASFTNKLLF